MQTFLPYPSLARSAAVLDDRRLGKQRVETLQVLRALHLEGYGWAHHPAVRMWRGHARALVAYGRAIVEEWRGRGFRDGTWVNMTEFAHPAAPVPAARLSPREFPPWLGDPALHRSHQAALVRKKPADYEPVFLAVDADLPSVWPQAPTGPPCVPPFTAWVVRAASADVLAAFRAEGLVALPVGLDTPKATPKQRRKAQRLRTARPGERVAVPLDGHLLCGTLRGAVVTRLVAGAEHLTLGAVFDRTAPRTALRRPYQLQDPQLMFALRGKAAVRATADDPTPER